MPSRNDQHASNRAARPPRRPTRAERGTVLLMVVGVLALLAIIATGVALFVTAVIPRLVPDGGRK